MAKFKYKRSKIGTILYQHILHNKRGYFIITILFFIGLMIAILFINHASDAQIEETNTYLTTLVNQVKTYEGVDLFSLFKQSVLSNFLLVILLWFGASTIIGIPVVYGSLLMKGFSIGYTISSIINCFGVGEGMLIALSALLLHNLLFIPTMFATGVSGIRMYQSIMKNKNRENIKIEIIRHTIFCALMLVIMLIAAFIEAYGSTNLFILLLRNLQK